MKLAIIIPGFQANGDDWCIPAFTNLAQELSKSAEMHVFALRYPPIRRSYRIGMVRVHAIGGGAVGGRRVPGVSLLKLWVDALMAVEREHRRRNFDAVVGIWATESGWLATRIAKRVGVPSLVHLAGGELTWLPDIGYGNARRGLASALVSRTIAEADVLTVPSSPMERALLARRGVDKAKVKRWSLGVDAALFSPCENYRPGQNGQPFTFITVSSLIPVKGHDWLLEGTAHLRQIAPRLDFRLQVIGSGPLLPTLRKQAADLDLRGYVNFLGEVRHDRLPGYFRAADCFILGSRHEAQCMAALEAMACGLAWIAPPVGSLVDCARTNNESDILVVDRNPRELAAAMQRMITAGPQARATWGAEARRRVQRDYELGTQARRLLALVELIHCTAVDSTCGGC